MSESPPGDPPFSRPGFRFSTRDGVAVVMGLLVTASLWRRVGSLSLLPLVVLGHFFLFCNVIRVRTRYELV